jgi:hypothetical protein
MATSEAWLHLLLGERNIVLQLTWKQEYCAITRTDAIAAHVKTGINTIYCTPSLRAQHWGGIPPAIVLKVNGRCWDEWKRYLSVSPEADSPRLVLHAGR